MMCACGVALNYCHNPCESTGGLGVSKKQSDNSGHSSNAMIRVFGAPSTSVSEESFKIGLKVEALTSRRQNNIIL